MPTVENHGDYSHSEWKRLVYISALNSGDFRALWILMDLAGRLFKGILKKSQKSCIFIYENENC
jgi:hypothetical protein